MSESILYFPSIEFRSPGWLKASLLVWDTVYRIVPAEYQPNDSYEVLQAIDNGLVRSVTLEPGDLKQVYEKFMHFYESLPTKPAGLDADDVERVHRDKIDARLYPILEQIATRFDDQWLHLSPELARGYMFYLAETVAKRRNLYRGTDNADAWVMASYIAEKGNFGNFVYDRAAEGQYCWLEYRHLIPLDVGRVPMMQVINFVESRADEKAEFRRVSQEFASELSKCESETHVRELIHRFGVSLVRAKQELRKSMDFISADSLYAMFGVGVPVSVGAIGTIASLGNVSPEGLLGAIGTGAVGALANYRQSRKMRRTRNHAAYLIDLDERLAREALRPKFDYIMDQFVND